MQMMQFHRYVSNLCEICYSLIFVDDIAVLLFDLVANITCSVVYVYLLQDYCFMC